MAPEEHVRRLLGAYALGHLDADEAAGVRAHLDGCPSCRAEAEDLSRVGRLLDLVDVERLGAASPPLPAGLIDRVLDRIGRERAVVGRRLRRRFGLGIAAAVAVAVGMLVVVAAPFGGSGEVVALTGMPGVRGEVTLHGRGSSQYVELLTEGLPVGETFAMWVRDGHTGERVRCGTFRVAPGTIHIALYSSVPRNRADEVGVSTLGGAVVMHAPLPPAED